MLESTIEKESTKYAVSLGWSAHKASSPGNRGQLDHIYHQGGFTFYIEYKATGKNATPKQRDRAHELSIKGGISCRCFDSIEKARDFINVMQGVFLKSSLGTSGFLAAHARYIELSKDLATFDV